MRVLINNRYILYERLGQGAMGAVYRAVDRLQDRIIALKQITVFPEELQFSSRTEGESVEDLYLSLANEFQTLASLRHPNIISVLDYGFDEHRQPYFTMDYLAEPENILEAGRGKSTEEKINLLVQVLQALAYLHRHGIIHRDLKSDNVLVANGRARLLDFGLSVAREAAKGRTGTLTYMAPEVLRTGWAVEASDLYAVGVMAYELFTGHRPFRGSDAMGILTHPPDMTAFAGEPDLAGVVEVLLRKDPAARYRDAQRAIAAFLEVLGRPQTIEEAAIRESYLQAAHFVGRDAELKQLMDAFDEARICKGSAWLVEGESGVGKTRLLEEVRIRALVRGALVLRGQGVESGSLPYHIWREPLRHLALAAELSDLEAGVLKPLVPDIGALLGREVPEPPTLRGSLAQQRLIQTIAGAVRAAARAAPPVVLLLDDLHWAITSSGSENLEPLKDLSRMVKDLPLLVVGSYRDDESPDLPAAVPEMQVIPLQRLDTVHIAQLSSSMLGDAGMQPHVINLLEQETEGNIFFLVETVRALAEGAGRLSDVGRATLPESVFTGGVQQIVRRRLNRVPVGDRQLLKLAAIVGRVLDLSLLQIAMPDADLEAWLTTCADVAVLIVQDENWQFAHDKLRETLLADLSDRERPALYRQVAEALEIAHPGDASYAAMLSEYWHVAGRLDKEAYYARIAGGQAAVQFANAEAVRFFSRAIRLLSKTDSAERYNILLARERVLDLQGARQGQAADLAALATLAETLGEEERAMVALRQANYALMTSDSDGAIKAAQTAVRLAHACQSEHNEALGRLYWGRGLWHQGEYTAAQIQLGQALEQARIALLPKVEADTLRTMGSLFIERACYEKAKVCFKQALHIYRDPRLEDRSGEAWTLSSIGFNSFSQGDYGSARTNLDQALQTFQQIGERPGEGQALHIIGHVCCSQGDFEGARDIFKSSLRIRREISDWRGESFGILGLGLVEYLEGNIRTAQEFFRQGLQVARSIGNFLNQGYGLTFLGNTLVDLGQHAEAVDVYQRALEVWDKLDTPNLIVETRAGLARLFFAQGDLPQASAQVDEILSHLKTRRLEGTWEPFRIYLTCYQILKADQDPRAQEILERSYETLLEQAAKLKDKNARDMYLENVPSHREIIVLKGMPEPC